jgi:hypothetical protein
MKTTSHNRQFYLNNSDGLFGIWNATNSNDIIAWRSTGVITTAVKSEVGLVARARDDVTNSGKEWQFYSSTNNHFAFWSQPANAEAMQLNTTIADTETALLIRRNVGGTFSLERVTQGAADSGGAGFKLLRVPN